MVDRSRLTEEDEYLAALSISSLASEDDECSDKEEEGVHFVPHIREKKFQKALASAQARTGKEEGDQSEDMESFLEFQRRDNYRLEPGNPTYATLEQGGKIACLQITIEKDLKVQDVVALSVYCVPHYVMDDDFMACAKKRRVRGNDFLGLQFELTMNDLSPIFAQDFDENHSINNSLALSRGSRKGDSPEHGKQPSIKLKSHLFNGTYTLVLSTSHGSLKAGEYALLVSIQPEFDEDGREKHSFLFHQDIRVMYDVVPEVKANAVAVNSSVEVSVGCKEYAYYRVVLANRSHTISLKVHSTEGDVDLFVTNQFDGLVPVSQENAIWQNCDPIDSIIQILPDDIHLIDVDRNDEKNVETFLVGLFGQAEGINRCTFSVAAGPPPDITRFVLSSEYEDEEAAVYQQGGSKNNQTGSGSSLLNQTANEAAKGRSDSEPFVLPLHEYRYFSVQFNPVERGRLAVVMDVNSLATSGNHLKLHERYLSMDTLIIEQNIDMNMGNSVYGSVQHLRHYMEDASAAHPFSNDIQSNVEPRNSTSMGKSTEKSSHLLSSPSQSPALAKQVFSSPTVTTKPLNPPSSASSVTGSGRKSSSAGVPDRDQYMVVMYISPTVAYPSHLQYTWKVAGHDKAVFVLDTSEWRYLSNTCYFSVFVFRYKPINLCRWRPSSSPLDDIDDAVVRVVQQKRQLQSSHPEPSHSVPSSSSWPESLTKREFVSECSVWLEEEDKVLLSSEMFQQRFKIFDDLYRAIDGFRLSYRDRRELLAGTLECDLSKDEIEDLDDHTLTYGEAEFQGFMEFLKEAGAVDGQIFYDLGSGVGKAMIAAALSGICFVKVIGVELLPSLIQCSRDVIEELTSQVRTTQNTSLNQSTSHNFNTSGTGLILRAGSAIQPEMAPGQAALLANMFPPLSPVRKGQQRQHNTQPNAAAWDGNQNNVNAIRDANREFIAVGGGGTTNMINLSGFSGGSQAGLMLMDDLSVVSSSTYSYQVNAIPDLKEKLKRAKISLPMLETRYVMEGCSYSFNKSIIVH